MSGYGGTDDASVAQLLHVEDSLALQRELATPADNPSGVCRECDEPIPQARLKAIPNCRMCIDCQNILEHKKGLSAAYKCRNNYVP